MLFHIFEKSPFSISDFIIFAKINKSEWTLSELNEIPQKVLYFYTIPSATLSAVIAPGLTEIHRSSAFDEFFFFFASDLVVAIESRLPQQQLPAPWRQQQQWQHTMKVVMMTRRGKVRRTTRHTVLKAPWLCLSVTKLHNCLKKSSTLSIFVLQKSGRVYANRSRLRKLWEVRVPWHCSN